MKRFSCVCGARLYFDSIHCGQCGRTVGFDPGVGEVRALDADGSGGWIVADGSGAAFAYCANGIQHGACN